MRMTILLAMALIAGGAPAMAQVQASFTEDHGRRTVLWEVAANGDYRVGDADGQHYRLVVGGDAYEVAERDGRRYAISLEGLAEATRRTTPGLVRGLGRYLTGLAAQEGDNLFEQGRATVAGWPGRRYRYATDAELDEDDRLRRRGEPPFELDRTDLVMSDDPALLPLGEAMRHRTSDDIFLSSAIVSRPSRRRLNHSLDWMASRGTLLRSSDGLELRSVRFDAPDPARLALPDAELLDADALEAMIRARRSPFRISR